MKILIPTLINGAAYPAAVLLKSAGHSVYVSYDKLIYEGVLSNSRIFIEAFEVSAPKGTLLRGYIERINTEVEDVYLDTICSLCESHGINLIWPFDDIQVAFFARNSLHVRARGIKVMVPDYAAVCLCSDKQTVILKAAQAGFPVPQSSRCSNLIEALDTFRAFGGQVVAKTPFTTGSRGVRRINDAAVLTEFCNTALEKNAEVIVQEFINGSTELSLNYLLDPNGETLCSFALEKHRHLMPSFSTAVRVASEPPELQLGAKLLRHLGLTGFCVIQTRRDDRTGQYKLVEINPRMGNNARILMSFDINFPAIWLDSVLGRQVAPINIPIGTCGVSPVEDLLTIYSFLRVSRRNRKREGLPQSIEMPSLPKYLGSLLRWYFLRRPYVDQHFRNLLVDTAANVGYYKQVIKELRTLPDIEGMLDLLPWGDHAAA
jgi:carbamoyl-phosphate synthase large subunit